MMGEFYPISNIPSNISISAPRETPLRTDPKGRTRNSQKALGTLNRVSSILEKGMPIALSKENSAISITNHNFIPQRQINQPENFKIASKLPDDFINKVRNSRPNYNLEELDTNPPTKVST